ISRLPLCSRGNRSSGFYLWGKPAGYIRSRPLGGSGPGLWSPGNGSRIYELCHQIYFAYAVIHANFSRTSACLGDGLLLFCCAAPGRIYCWHGLYYGGYLFHLAAEFEVCWLIFSSV